LDYPPDSSAPDNIAKRVKSWRADHPIVGRLLPEFVSELPAQVAELVRLTAQDNLGGLRRIAHQMKGTGGGYGFDAMSDLAAQAEEAVSEGQAIDAIRERVESLVRFIRSIEGYDPAKETGHETRSARH
jgi:HPt (histidine-containing phosphotransfer) domain-containing protein